MSTLAKREVTVEEALKEVRGLFNSHFSLKIIECESSGCAACRYEVSLGCPEEHFGGPTLKGVLAQVRKWKEGQLRIGSPRD